MTITGREVLVSLALAGVLTAAFWPAPTVPSCLPERPAIGRPGADGSGATGRVGDDLQWEIYAERPELGDPPVEVWVHGQGWSVHCAIKPPGTGTRCVEMREPARVERSGR